MRVEVIDAVSHVLPKLPHTYIPIEVLPSEIDNVLRKSLCLRGCVNIYLLPVWHLCGL